MLRIEAGGYVDPRIAILAAGFEQQDGGLAIGGQAIGEHAAGRTGADDDEVEFLCSGHDVPLASFILRYGMMGFAALYRS